MSPPWTIRRRCTIPQAGCRDPVVESKLCFHIDRCLKYTNSPGNHEVPSPRIAPIGRAAPPLNRRCQVRLVWTLVSLRLDAMATPSSSYLSGWGIVIHPSQGFHVSATIQMWWDIQMRLTLKLRCSLQYCNIVMSDGNKMSDSATLQMLWSHNRSLQKHKYKKQKESGHMIGVSKNPDDLLILANLACSWINTINFAIGDRSASACDTLRMNTICRYI